MLRARRAYNITKGKALLAAYQAGRALTPDEQAALPVLMRGAALRFLLTRLYDWLNPDPNALVRPKDPREYAKRLRFHLKVKACERVRAVSLRIELFTRWRLFRESGTGRLGRDPAQRQA